MPPVARRGAVVVSLVAALVIVGAGLSASESPAATSMPTAGSSGPATDATADVVVYGGTSGGVVAAVSAARAGASVLLISPTDSIGGMTSNGISAADVARRDLVGGIPLEFFRAVGKAYNMDQYGNYYSWRFEPHVASNVFESMVAGTAVHVIRGVGLDRSFEPEVAGRHIQAIRLTSGAMIRGGVFIDASYEGDLLALVGAAYRVGREAASAFGERLAGVQPLGPVTSAKDKVYGRRYTNDQPLPGVSGDAIGVLGSSDDAIQAYTYRLCVTTDPANRRAIQAPEGYDAHRFDLVDRALTTWTTRGITPALSDLLTLTPIPGGKYDLNDSGTYSTDMPGASTTWPEATDAERQVLAATHRQWVQGLLWFLQSSPDVPAGLAADVGQLGLCADEFEATGNWPDQIYVREARRLVGLSTLTEQDVEAGAGQPDSIGLGSYTINFALRRACPGCRRLRRWGRWDPGAGAALRDRLLDDDPLGGKPGQSPRERRRFCHARGLGKPSNGGQLHDHE